MCLGLNLVCGYMGEGRKVKSHLVLGLMVHCQPPMGKKESMGQALLPRP